MIKELEKISWINNIELHDSFIRLGVEKGDEKIPVIIELSREMNVKIKSISVRKPTLDDVFIHYTGRTIRDQENSYLIKNIPPRFGKGVR